MAQEILLPIISLFLAFLMVWGVGANDLANILSTSLGSKSVSVKQALIIAVTFELAGALLGSSGVSNTMRAGIININLLANTPQILSHGMLAILIAGTFWINYASHHGLPVSITNAIVGAFVGFGVIVLGPQAIMWKKVIVISLSWLFAPVTAAVLAYCIFTTIQNTILAVEEPLMAAKDTMPYYLFLVGVILTLITVIKGLHQFDLKFGFLTNFTILCCCGLLYTFIMNFFMKRVLQHPSNKRRVQFILIERMFAILMISTTCAMVFAHGSNDVGVAMGPLLVLETLWYSPESALTQAEFPLWIILFGVTGVILGLFFYGRKVIATVGSRITALTPSRAFAATLAAATTVVLATSTGIPVSATQTLVGAVLGVGLARGIGALNITVMRNIILSWVITIPVVCILTIICYEILSWLGV